MLTSKKLELRRSEIRQNLSELANIETPSADETRKMTELDTEYRAKEVQYRAALVSEDEERRDAGNVLETRSEKEWTEIMGAFEMRQVALSLDEGRALDGQTAEIVTELRSAGGYRGIPVPYAALETRAGETIASGTPNPIATRPLIERLFPASVAAQMGVQMINIGSGDSETPVTTSAITAGWQATETGNVPGPSAYATLDRPLAPDHTLGIQMRITRKTLKQSGAALEQAIRRDMNGAMSQEMDRAIFNGSGASGEPTGVFTGATAWGIAENALDAAATWAAFRSEVVAFITENAANGPAAVRLLIRPEVWDTMDGSYITGTAVTEWERLMKYIGSVTMSHNALPAPALPSGGTEGDPLESMALLTTSAGGVAPVFVGLWGAVDLIRDPYADAQSGGLRLTALSTMDTTISRAVQSRVLTGIQ
ncbi:phage major capsid protein [Sulfitobacter guttiformis]|jgi:HK97 family phage major capsid protein|uniref:HK97 family phage major capsid protein n=1 Tax=Sulfitobacter guttiformis TaxID=74349 RepID=A0A420DHI7_9RHOB|nr:phage major capsid protein [Sulfitobacter guttiformis]KIN72561.1 putative phage-related protein [Sulfitobacter guttiformis KCTC 32187]RKE93693.1 HK97 family phage major capsid protein [Sulfitobacter guttiformis]